jgi:hypothetical protein
MELTDPHDPHTIPTSDPPNQSRGIVPKSENLTYIDVENHMDRTLIQPGSPTRSAPKQRQKKVQESLVDHPLPFLAISAPVTKQQQKGSRDTASPRHASERAGAPVGPRA